ncbi:riboflavin biosynthesis protein RibF [Asticcacaulis sp. AC402]|uniref:riboflavin biosynthesis protein RibF n=1 Tax=Asticcacaulis sp. AC402 TaxID=1282361 RepID=UPI0003C3EFC7|nr:riboflavin biosynthesis protein RibF [Asticcacaulis sp. AC402]ESQ74054.1 riboflavin biosynthesis protein RibF [Asticcacaulis sp. AC402]
MFSFDSLPPALRPHRLTALVLTVLPDGGLQVEGGELPKGTSAAIGSFDGVHIGHQHVIHNALFKASLKNARSSVICFDPHPQSFFRPDGAPFRLMRVSQQVRAFEALGVDYALIIRFDENLSSLSAEDFARIILRDHLALKHCSAGFDFQFGKRGGGHAKDLVAFGEQFGFSTDILPLQTDHAGHKLSSSAVRDALAAGDARLAETVLGRPQAYLGEVVHGAKQGRTIDFPTLNIRLADYLRPRYGIYVTQTRLGDGRVVNGVSNIGVRPTVGGDIELLETYLFDFKEEIYGQTVETLLRDFIRPEAKFDSFEEMRVQIQKDAYAARTWFRQA